MVFDAADAVEVCSLGLNYLVLEEGVEIRLHLRRNQPKIIFRVPGDVQIYLRIDSDGHIRLSKRRKRRWDLVSNYHGLKAVAKLKRIDKNETTQRNEKPYGTTRV